MTEHIPLTGYQKTIMETAVGGLPKQFFSRALTGGETAGNLAALPIELSDRTLMALRTKIEGVVVFTEKIDSKTTNRYAFIESGGIWTPVSDEAAWPPSARVMELFDAQTMPTAPKNNFDLALSLISIVGVITTGGLLWDGWRTDTSWPFLIFFTLLLVGALGGSASLVRYCLAPRRHQRKRSKAFEAMKALRSSLYASPSQNVAALKQPRSEVV